MTCMQAPPSHVPSFLNASTIISPVGAVEPDHAVYVASAHTAQPMPSFPDPPDAAPDVFVV
jgi:hypothetical protein